MKYIILVQSSVITEAETPEEATDQVDGVLEDAHERNCGGIEDEILANTKIVKIEIEESSDK